MVDLFDREDSLNSVRGQTNFSRNQEQHYPPPPPPPPPKENTLENNFVISDFAKPNSLNSFERKSAIRFIDDIQIKINR